MIFLGFVNAFLQVLAIIGIILVGGFVIFFLGDLVLSVLDPNYVRFGKRKKKDEEDENETKQLAGPNGDTKELGYDSKEFTFDDEDVAEPIINTEKESSNESEFFKDDNLEEDSKVDEENIEDKQIEETNEDFFENEADSISEDESIEDQNDIIEEKNEESDVIAESQNDNEEYDEFQLEFKISGTPTTIFLTEGEEISKMQRISGKTTKAKTISKLTANGYIKDTEN